jgi:hypothetical protein
MKPLKKIETHPQTPFPYLSRRGKKKGDRKERHVHVHQKNAFTHLHIKKKRREKEGKKKESKILEEFNTLSHAIKKRDKRKRKRDVYKRNTCAS